MMMMMNEILKRPYFYMPGCRVSNIPVQERPILNMDVYSAQLHNIYDYKTAKEEEDDY